VYFAYRIACGGARVFRLAAVKADSQSAVCHFSSSQLVATFIGSKLVCIEDVEGAVPVD